MSTVTTYPPTSAGPARRGWEPHLVFLRALVAGCLTGALLGAGLAAAIMGSVAVHDPEALPAVLLYGLFGAVVGALIGTVLAAVSVTAVLLARLLRPSGLGTARLVGAAGAAAPAVVLLHDAPTVALVVGAVSAVCAIAWMRWIAGLPRPSHATRPVR